MDFAFNIQVTVNIDQKNSDAVWIGDLNASDIQMRQVQSWRLYAYSR
jgi:hypothetical protein